MCEADGYDAMKAAAEGYCAELGYHFIPGSVVRAVLFSVVDGKRVMHDPTGKDVVTPVTKMDAADAANPSKEGTAFEPKRGRKAKQPESVPA